MTIGCKLVDLLPDRALGPLEVEAFDRRSRAYVRAQVNVITHELREEVHGLLVITPRRSFGVTYTGAVIATEDDSPGWALLAEGDDPVRVCNALNAWADDMRHRRRAEISPEGVPA